MTIELVVFDMAGTTVKDKNFVHQAFVDAFAKNGKTVSIADVNPLMGYPKPIAIDMVLEKYVWDRNEKLIDSIHTDFVNNMIDFYKNNPSVEEIKGVSDLFRSLKEKRIKIAIDTGFSKIIMDTIIERLGWRKNKLIDFAVASDEVENGRPYADMILKAMKNFGITDSKKVAKVGDTSSDMNQGTAADCAYVIGVTTGAFSREDLKKEPHTHIIDGLEELENIILKEKICN